MQQTFQSQYPSDIDITITAVYIVPHSHIEGYEINGTDHLPLADAKAAIAAHPCTNACIDAYGHLQITDEVNLPQKPCEGTPVYRYFQNGDAIEVKYITRAGGVLPAPLRFLEGKPVGSMENMFYECVADTLDLRNICTSNVTSMYGMFEEVETATLDLQNFNPASAGHLTGLFRWGKMGTLDLQDVKMPPDVDVNFMFTDCEIDTVNFTRFDASNITDTANMFYEFRGKTLDLSGWDTANITSMVGMFECSEIAQLNISNFDFSQAENMSDMFGEANIGTLIAENLTGLTDDQRAALFAPIA